MLNNQSFEFANIKQNFCKNIEYMFSGVVLDCINFQIRSIDIKYSMTVKISWNCKTSVTMCLCGLKILWGLHVKAN